jgi:diadenosine tetraphosphate (Ap4A) HIT family hydrolase
MDCPFCQRDTLEVRVFYDDTRWFAFLAAPYHTKGHAILAVRKQDGMSCPEGLRWEIFAGFDRALATVARVLQKHYQPKDILFASMRGDITHTHCHLIPRWKDEEVRWRENNSYGEKGHLLEFVGFLEKTGDATAKAQRDDKGLTDEEQRTALVNTPSFRADVEALRRLTGYPIMK